MKRYLLFILMATAMVSCRKDPSISDFDGEFLVYTAHSEDVSDFSKYRTFTIVDSVRYIDGPNTRMVLNDWCKELISKYRKAMEDYGYTYVATGKKDDDQSMNAPADADADLGIQIFYIVSTDYFTTHVPAYDPWWNYPGYWSPGYWGNWTSWYYPFTVTYSYSAQSLLTDIVDRTDKERKDLPVVWNSYIDGSIGNTYQDRGRFSKAIEQSFAQSEYLDIR